MGYAVLHLDKAPGNEAPMTAHIERTQMPKNADPERTHLNRELLEFPEGVCDRTQAIQYRLDNARLTRKIGVNQVRAIRVMLTGSPEDMQQIQADGKLNEWCNDNLDWLRETYGTDNLVSAVLHMDEATPHIHATVVPIVTGERRKAKEKKTPEQPGKKQYRKKNPNAARLCADDVMARAKLTEYQDSYAEAMSKYGLQRGIKGSEARHITTQEFYRNAIAQKANLQENIDLLLRIEEAKRQSVEQLEQKEQEARVLAEQATVEKQQTEKELAGKQSELQKVKGELKTEKFKGAAAEAGSVIMDGLSSALGTSKVKRQQQEIETLKGDNAELAMRLKNKDRQIQNLQKQYKAEIDQLNQIHSNELSIKQKEIDRITFWFPDIPHMAKTADYCLEVGFNHRQTKELLMLRPVQYTGKLKSPKTQRTYDADNVIARLEKPQGASTFVLTINKIPIIQWFKQKYQELKEKLSNRGERKQNTGPKIGR